MLERKKERKKERKSIFSKKTIVFLLILTFSLILSLTVTSCNFFGDDDSDSTNQTIPTTVQTDTTKWYQGVEDVFSIAKGKPGDFYIDLDDYILYKMDADGAWQILITDFGRPGEEGPSNAQEILLQTDTIDGVTYIQWKYENDQFWTNLIDLKDIQGNPGTDGKTPIIGENGNWFIGTVDTRIPAKGQNATPPTIGDNGNWFIEGEDTGVYAKGNDGATPTIGENNNWFIDGVDTGILALGSNGITPSIKDGNWYIGEEDTGIVAIGTNGSTPEIGENNNWWIAGVDTGILAKGQDGVSRDVEFNTNATHIQWKYVDEDDNAYRNLVSLEALGTANSGSSSTPAEQRDIVIAVEGDYIAWKYDEVGASWNNIIAVEALKGANGTDAEQPSIGANGNWYIGSTDTGVKAKGTDGREIELRKGADAIEWSYAGTDVWTTLVELSDIKGETGSDGNDGANANEVEIGFNGDYIAWRYKTGADLAWKNIIDKNELKGSDGLNGTDGKTPYVDEDGYWVIGETVTEHKAVGVDGLNGNNGKEIELQKGENAIQWRYVGDTDWTDLVSLEAIKGDKGNDGQNGTNGTNGKEIAIAVNDGVIQWHYTTGDDTSWNDVIALSALKGADGAKGDKGDAGQNGTNGYTPYVNNNGYWEINGVATEYKAAGTNGREVTFQVTESEIQWQYVGDSDWNTLVALEALRGPQGIQGETGAAGSNGTNGTNGREVEIEVIDGNISWRYVAESDSAWQTIISTTALVGAQGEKGETGADGKDGTTPHIGDDGYWYIGETKTDYQATGATGKDGREIEIQKGESAIQWRYVGETDWINLVSLTAIKGDKGDQGETGTAGSNGTNGKSVKIAINSGVIQWRYTDDSNDWQDIIATSELKGTTGNTPYVGDNGNWFIGGVDHGVRAVAQDVQMQVADGYIQWKLEGDASWTNLLAVSAIKGDKGDDGADGATWSTGTTAPSDTFGKDGDLYLDTLTSDVYQKANGTWGSPVCNIKGAAGTSEGVDVSDLNNRLTVLEGQLNEGKLPITNLDTYTDETIYDKNNMIEDATYSIGYIYNQNNNANNSSQWGALSSYANETYRRIEEYIPVKAGSTYVIFGDGVAATFLHYAWYNANKEYIEMTGDNILPGTQKLTPPEGAEYVRFSIQVTEISFSGNNPLEKIEMFEQSSTTYVAPYPIATIKGIDADISLLAGSVTPETTNFFDVYDSPNVYNGLRAAGKYANPTQYTIGSNESYVLLNPVKVTPGQTITIWKNGLQKTFRFIICHDETGERIHAGNIGTDVQASEYVVPKGVAYLTITLPTGSYAETGMQIQCADTSSYLGYYDPQTKIYKLKKEFYEAYSNEPIIHAYLPAEINIASGRTIELYNEQICLEADDYNVQWVTNGFTAYVNERKISITGTDALVGSSKTLTYKLYDDNLELVYTAQTTVNFVSSTIENKQYIIPIGDSLTNSKIWLSEVQANLSGGMIEWIGTNRYYVNSTTSYYHEGRSGAGTGWYNGNNTYSFSVNSYTTNLEIQTDEDGTNYTTNPFWNEATGQFDFDNYCNTYHQGVTPTGVMIYLGTNGIQLDATTSVNNIVTLVENIQNSTMGANIPIYVVHTLFRPSQYNSKGSDNAYVSTTNEFEQQANLKVMNLQNMLYDELKDNANVVFVPIASTHDSEYNFPYEEVPVNPHSDKTEIKYTDTTHPGEAGYLQMADIIFSTIAANS